MLKSSVKALKMPFKEPKRDKEGNIVLDKDNNPVYVKVYRNVWHNVAYIPR